LLGKWIIDCIVFRHINLVGIKTYFIVVIMNNFIFIVKQ
jgi:hypothetical protein